MKTRLDKIKALAKQHAPWLLIGGGGALILFANYKTAQFAGAKVAEAAAESNDILVLQECPPNEGDNVYEDLDNPGMYYEVRPL